MSQSNRNELRDRRGGEPRRYEEADERRYSSNRHEERARGMARVNAERSDRRSYDRENDLYERQSI